MDISALIDKGMYVLLGVLVTAATNHFLSKSREKQIHKIISFNDAAEKFRHSFDDALLKIDQEASTVTLILGEVFTAHKIAMWHFRYYLSGKERGRFDRTWGKYKKFHDDNRKQSDIMDERAPKTKTDEEKTKRGIFRQHIETLIKYTTEERKYGWF